MKIYFVTANEMKIEESKSRFERFIERVQSEEGGRLEIEFQFIKRHLDELLDLDIDRIVRKKVIEAYKIVRMPCVVEHGGLFLDAWRSSEEKAGKEKAGLLGGIGQIVWEAVGQRMCHFLREEDPRGAEAQSVVGYCDGRHILTYPGKTRGEVTDQAWGQGLRWDPIFKPAGSDQTYGQMPPEEKRKTSPEEEAWNKFFQDLKKDLRERKK